MLKDEKCTVFLYIPLFLVLSAAFLILLVWEFKSFWGGGNLNFDREKSVFWEYEGAGSTILTVLLVIQAIWGFSFLKEACKFYIIQSIIAFRGMLFPGTFKMIGHVHNL